MKELVLDTSVAVPYVMGAHQAHDATQNHLGKRRPRLSGHSLVETYSVLTRLPGDARLAPGDAATLIQSNFVRPVLLDDETAASLPALLAPLGIAGGAVYDALVALAALRAGLAVATRDRRAAATYAALQVEVELVVS